MFRRIVHTVLCVGLAVGLGVGLISASASAETGSDYDNGTVGPKYPETCGEYDDGCVDPGRKLGDPGTEETSFSGEGSSSSLPFTGADITGFVIVGLACLGAGFAIRKAGKRSDT